MRSRSFVAASIGVLLLGVVGCSGLQTGGGWTWTDSWYSPPADPSLFGRGRCLPASDVAEVLPDRMAAAATLLRDVACVEIPEKQARELTGKAMESRAGSRLYLVRGVYLNRGANGFDVTPMKKELLVEHGCLGRSAVPMKRQALVVRLQRKPDVVYVSCWMLE